MKPDELLAVFDREQRVGLEAYGFRREVTSAVVRHVPEPGFGGEGFISYSRLDDRSADEVIREQIGYFSALALDFEWKAYDHDPPPDLLQRLATHGFECEEPEALCVLDLEDAPPGLWQPVTQEVQRILDPASLEDVTAVHDQVWGESHPWLVSQLAKEMNEDGDHISVYAVYSGGVPVSSAWIRFHPPSQFASLWGGSTLPEYRRRGFYTALLAVRAQEARRRGFRFLTIDASPMSRPIVERHGFQFLTYTHPCKWRSRGSSSQVVVLQEP